MLSALHAVQIKGHGRSEDEGIISCLGAKGGNQGLFHGGSAGFEDQFGFKQVMMAENSNPDRENVTMKQE